MAVAAPRLPKPLPTRSAATPTPFPINLQPLSTLPIPTFTLEREINGLKTELLIQDYDDRVLVVITQLGRVGSMTQVSLSPLLPLQQPLHRPPQPSTTDSPSSPTSPSESNPILSLLPLLPPPHPSTTLTPLLSLPPPEGMETLYEMIEMQVGTLVWWILENPRLVAGRVGAGRGRKPVVVSLALKREKTSVEEQDEGVDEQANGDGWGLSERERERFAGIMGMIAEWPGC